MATTLEKRSSPPPIIKKVLPPQFLAWHISGLVVFGLLTLVLTYGPGPQVTL